MNCDQVFEVLTRGPFPANCPDDLQVEQHLNACHPCREMAEALRPAVSLFHESLSGDESAGLPGYRGQLPVCGEEIDQVVTTVLAEAPLPRQAAPPQVASQQPAARSRSFTWLLAVSIALSSFAVGLWFSTAVRNGPLDRSTTAGQSVELLRLASLRLPAACFQEGQLERSNGPVDFALADLNCCRNCHVTHSKSRPPLDALAAVVTSCSACHQSDSR